ncbi:hypothetical protein BDQ17DRAFT_1324455 [Cyathus striatus]|nr:hypothetical protein BDQ17DRAFT_1324455 [Cyathus striatus]
MKRYACRNVVMPSEAIELIHKNAEHLTPVAMVAIVQEAYPIVMAMQVYRAWVAMTQTFWQQDDLQIPSAHKLLRELRDYVDVLSPSMLPDGVEMLCWGMMKIAQRLMGKVVEIGIDATLSAISQGKRTKCLAAWAQCLKNTYDINPVFIHINKDMAEISAACSVWSTKISICWWHMQKALREQLKLRRPDKNEHEGGKDNEPEENSKLPRSSSPPAPNLHTANPSITSPVSMPPPAASNPLPASWNETGDFKLQATIP